MTAHAPPPCSRVARTARERAVALGILALLTACRASGSIAPPISTDRPGFLFSPSVLPARRFQVETGPPTLTLLRGGGDETRAWTFPVALRYGLSERVELRVSLPTWSEVRAESGSTADSIDGFGDSEIGLKAALAPLAGGPLAAQASLRLPTGSAGLTTDEIGASAYLMHGRDLGRGFGATLLAGAMHTPIEGLHDATSGALAVLVGHPLAEGWSAYGETSAFPGLSNVAGQSYVGTGIAWMPRPDLQLDLSADFGLGDHSADVIASFGISWCLDTSP